MDYKFILSITNLTLIRQALLNKMSSYYYMLEQTVIPKSFVNILIQLVNKEIKNDIKKYIIIKCIILFIFPLPRK